MTDNHIADRVREQLATESDYRVRFANTDEEKVEAATKAILEELQREKEDRNTRRWARAFAWLCFGAAVLFAVVIGLDAGSSAGFVAFYAAFAGFMGAILWQDSRK